MNFKMSGITALVAGLLIPAAALAQTVFPKSGLPADGTAVVQQLQKQEQIDEFKAKYWSQEPITQQDYYVQEKLDRNLIARISAGEPVSSDQLAEALRRVGTDY